MSPTQIWLDRATDRDMFDAPSLPCLYTGYHSCDNEAWLTANGMVSEIHRKNPRGRPMSRPTSRVNGRKSVVRSKVEHVLGHQKDRIRQVIRTIGLARAKVTITMANMVYNMCRLRWLFRRGAPA